MTNYNIIGFCGRLQSGKSTIANICEHFGYERLYFALPLKKLCADILSISIKELNELKINKTNINLIISNEICNKISIETNIPLEHIISIGLNRTMKDVRELLQFVGTDIIRKYNTDWHVNKIKEMMDPNKKYVFDDIRFQNELKFIQSLGGTIWFVVRPCLNNVSNHESETSIKWQDVDKVFINDKPFREVIHLWTEFMSNGFQNSCEKRDKLKQLLCSVPDLNVRKSIIDTLSMSETPVFDTLLLSKWELLYTKVDFDNLNKDNLNVIYNTVFVQNISDNNQTTLCIINNPLNIEDLKFKISDMK